MAQARQYGDELEAAIRAKAQRDEVERRNRMGERDDMTQKLAQKGM